MSDLVVVLHLDGDVIVARCDLLCAVGQLADGVGEPTAEQHGKQQVKHQQKQRHRAQDRPQHLGGGGDLCQTCGDDDAVLAVCREPPHAHLHGGTDLHDLVQLTVLEQLLPQLNGYMGVHIVAERAVECTGALVQQAGVHTLVGFRQRSVVSEKSTQQLSTLIFLSWNVSLTPSQKSSFSVRPR